MLHFVKRHGWKILWKIKINRQINSGLYFVINLINFTQECPDNENLQQNYLC